MAEEWVNDTRNEARVKANLRVDTNKALGAAEQKNKELASKLVTEEKAYLSAEVGLKNAEDQRKKLHLTEIELATQRQLVLDLKAELQKSKEATWVAKEVSEAEETASYERGVQETEIRLADELAEVCRDYCKEVWAEALNRVEVPATSE